MNYSKKYICQTICKFVALVLTIIAYSISFTSCSLYPIYTDDIKDYNSSAYPVDQILFFETIPDNVEVVDFAHYAFWDDSEDIYLELKFKTIEELNKYISNIKNQVQENTSLKPPENNEWFLEQKNPYNEKYTDLLCLYYRYGRYYGQNFMQETGYEFSFRDEDEILDCRCYYGIISYSYSDLLVIQTVAEGTFLSASDDYYPQYLQKFDVDIKESESRLIAFEI